jgi:hypothetical protein
MTFLGYKMSEKEHRTAKSAKGAKFQKVFLAFLAHFAVCFKGVNHG